MIDSEIDCGTERDIDSEIGSEFDSGIDCEIDSKIDGEIDNEIDFRYENRKTDFHSTTSTASALSMTDSVPTTSTAEDAAAVAPSPTREGSRPLVSLPNLWRRFRCAESSRPRCTFGPSVVDAAAAADPAPSWPRQGLASLPPRPLLARASRSGRPGNRNGHFLKTIS